MLVNQAPHQLDLWQWLCGVPKAAFAKLGFIKVAENAHAGFDRPTSITMQRPVSMTERETAA